MGRKSHRKGQENSRKFLTTKRVRSEEEVMKLLKIGELNRAVASTNMNDTSSRSHTYVFFLAISFYLFLFSLFTLVISQKSVNGSMKSGSLNLVDLAGTFYKLCQMDLLLKT